MPEPPIIHTILLLHEIWKFSKKIEIRFCFYWLVLAVWMYLFYSIILWFSVNFPLNYITLLWRSIYYLESSFWFEDNWRWAVKWRVYPVLTGYLLQTEVDWRSFPAPNWDALGGVYWGCSSGKTSHLHGPVPHVRRDGRGVQFHDDGC